RRAERPRFGKCLLSLDSKVEWSRVYFVANRILRVVRRQRPPNGLPTAWRDLSSSARDQRLHNCSHRGRAAVAMDVDRIVVRWAATKHDLFPADVSPAAITNLIEWEITPRVLAPAIEALSDDLGRSGARDAHRRHRSSAGR